MTGAASSDGMLIIHDVWGKHRRQTCYLPVFKHGPWNNKSVTHILQQQPKELCDILIHRILYFYSGSVQIGRTFLGTTHNSVTE